MNVSWKRKKENLCFSILLNEQQLLIYRYQSAANQALPD